MSVIFGLSSCDLGEKFLKSYGVEVINLELNINGNNYLYNADNFKFEQYYNLTNYSVEYNGLESLIEAKNMQISIVREPNIHTYKAVNY